MNTDEHGFPESGATAVFMETHGAVSISFIRVYPCPSVVNLLVVNEN